MSDDFIRDEVLRLQYLYKQNDIIRFSHSRDSIPHKTQSVGEHVYTLVALANYFFKLENLEGKIDLNKVIKMLLVHDMTEIVTGDVICVAKTNDDTINEANALNEVKGQLPQYFASNYIELVDEFEQKQTAEALFAQSLDKFEGQLSWITREWVMEVIEVDKRKGIDINEVYIQTMDKVYSLIEKGGFSVMKRYLDEIDNIRMSHGLIIPK